MEPYAGANAINTHRRVVGTTADFFHPFLWTPEAGMPAALPTLRGHQGQPNDMNELAQIAGTSVTAGGALRAVLWIPGHRAGPRRSPRYKAKPPPGPSGEAR